MGIELPIHVAPLDSGSRSMNNLPMTRRIDSVDALVAAFGGTSKLAEFLDVGMSTVSNWKKADDIPPGWHMRLFLEAADRGFTIDTKFFGSRAEMRPRHKGRKRRKAKVESRPAA